MRIDVFEDTEVEQELKQAFVKFLKDEPLDDYEKESIECGIYDHRLKEFCEKHKREDRNNWKELKI